MSTPKGYERISLEGKSIIVTGAGSGMGAETAKLIAQRGAKVTAVDLNEAAVQATVDEITAAGGEAQICVANIVNPEDTDAMVRAAVDTYGTLDAAFNNAGIIGKGGLISDITVEDWQQTIDINLTGVFNSMKSEIAYFETVGQGIILNTASTAGLIAYPNLPSYVASKHGVVGLTKQVGLDYARKGIRVNAILPGSVDTPLATDALQDPEQRAKVDAAQPIGRLGYPWEIAEAAAFLLSEASGFLIGATVTVDGGVTAG